jgi:two-component system, LytTR family, response regulator
MSLPLRVIVCDDELMARKRVLRLLEESGQVEVARECASADEVLTRLSVEEFDIALLDINMPGTTGIELVEKMGPERPYVVFLTAHPEHALKAFEVGAIDYLLKPVDDVRLKKALDRARGFLDAEERSEGAAIGGPGTKAPQLTRLAVPTKAGVVLINPTDITHATFDGSLVTLYTRDKQLLTDFTLQDLEDKVGAGDPGSGAPFVRVHRRALLNLELTERLEPNASGGYVARVVSGQKVEVSRQAARRLRKWLGLST